MQPTPATEAFVQHPDWLAQGAGQMADSAINGDDQIEARNQIGGVLPVAQARGDIMRGARGKIGQLRGRWPKLQADK